MKKKITLALLLAMGVSQAEIKQSLGVDPSVDYAALTQLGPWDDRNYQLTKNDLSVLPQNDQYLSHVPVFFKVKVRKEHPNYGEYYPRSTLQLFQIEYGGLLVDGIWYKDGLGKGYHPTDTYGKSPKEQVRATADSETPLALGVSGNEVTIECNPTNPNNCVAGSNQSGGQTMFWSDDAGATWTLSQTNPASCCDPSVDWSADGTIVYQADLASDTAIRWSRSLDQGHTWEAMQRLTPGGRDKEFIHVDRSNASPFKDNLYLSWHDGNVVKFAKSTDMGLTFSAITSFDAEPRGIGSDFTTDSAGNIYYFYPSTNATSGIRLLKSTDGGNTWAGSQVSPLNDAFDFPLPSMESRNAFVYTSADLNTSTDDIYVAWTDQTDDSANTGASNNHAWINVAKSTDEGDTWNLCAHPHDTSDTIAAGNAIDRYHPWLKIGENGVIHIGYYDTRHSTNRTGVDFFYTVSLDGCTSWEPEERYTTETSVNINNGQEWGDYNGLSVVVNRLAMSFTDNRPSIGQTAMIASGENLFSEPSFTLTATPTSLDVCANSSNNTVNFDVAPLQDYVGIITLTEMNAPAFITASSLTPSVVTAPAMSTYAFDVDGSGTTGTHMVTIEATGVIPDLIYQSGFDPLPPRRDNRADVGATIVKSLDLNIVYSAGIPAAVTLITPIDAGTGINLTPTFTWSADANALRYTIEIATDVAFVNIVDTATVDTNSYTPSTDLPSTTVIFWRVTANSPCGDTVSSVSSFTTSALPGDCALNEVQTELFNYDFEAGAQGWTTQAIQGAASWQLQAAIVNSGVQAYNSTDLDNTSDNVLTSPDLILPAGQGPLTLRFWNQQSMEANGGNACWDGGLVEVSTDGGTTYNQILNDKLINDPYNGNLSGGPLTGSQAWCGDPQAGLVSSVDIDQFAGSTVKLRFRIVTDGSVGRPEGWTIDDVKVTGCAPAP
jgi:hypothetical protein